MIKIFFCSIAAWLIISCSSDLKVGPVDDRENQNFNPSPSGQIKEGFQKHDDYPYGFDSDGGIVHISIPTSQIGFTGYVKVITDKELAEDYEYYYCDPDSWEEHLDIGYIPADKMQEHKLEIANLTPQRIALCRNKHDEMELVKVQELHIHRYLWKNHDFYVYTFGNAPTWQYEFLDRDRNAFWKEFDAVYNQAVVRYGDVANDKSQPIYLSNAKRSYILSRARGNNYDDYAYDNVKCAEGDIGKAINEMEGKALPKKSAVIQVDSPVKRFWPLRINGNKIEICGKPDIDQEPKLNTTLVLELLPNTPFNLDCPNRIAHGITVRWYANAWYLASSDGDMELATVYNAHPGCAVFAERNAKSLGQDQDIGEISKGKGAEAVRLSGKKVTTVVLPWQGSLEVTKTIAIHELGHTMGLDDVNLNTNLMHYANRGTSRLLQKRSVSSFVNGRQENQWDCLQALNFSINCASPNFIYREP
jgi:hypothetical protein